MFRGNLQQTGVYDAAGLAKFNATKWKFQTSGRVIGSPAVVNGVVTWAAGMGIFTLSMPNPGSRDGSLRQRPGRTLFKVLPDFVG